MLAVGFVRVFFKLIEEFELVTCFLFVWRRAVRGCFAGGVEGRLDRQCDCQESVEYF